MAKTTVGDGIIRTGKDGDTYYAWAENHPNCSANSKSSLEDALLKLSVILAGKLEAIELVIRRMVNVN